MKQREKRNVFEKRKFSVGEMGGGGSTAQGHEERCPEGPLALQKRLYELIDCSQVQFLFERTIQSDALPSGRLNALSFSYYCLNMTELYGLHDSFRSPHLSQRSRNISDTC